MNKRQPAWFQAPETGGTGCRAEPVITACPRQDPQGSGQHFLCVQWCAPQCPAGRRGSLRITQLQTGGTGFSPIASTFRKLPKVFANHLPFCWLGEGSWQNHTVPCSSHVTADVESGRHVTEASQNTGKKRRQEGTAVYTVSLSL